MDPRRWEEIQAAFEELAELEAADRRSRLAVIGTTDPALRAAIESLLVADAEADDLLASIDAALLSPAGTQPVQYLKDALADRYRIERELGRGGMATVYLAEDLRHERMVAVKVLRPELAAVIGAERFLREIKLTARLNHPHILPLFDSGEAGRFLYYVMPHVDGETLRDRLNRDGQLGLEDAVQITRGVADALSHAHGMGVIHRDIKPENIMVSGGHVVVADFGIARAVAEAGGDRLTETGLAVGTPAYMSPEQGAGESQVDGRSDLYSLGCVLYEMLAGDPPFAGSSAQAILARKAVDPVPSLRVVRRGVSEAVQQVLLRALERAPGDRFATVQQFAQALEAAASGTAQAADERHHLPTRWPVAVAAAVVILGGGWWGINALGPADVRIERLAVLPFDNLMQDDAQDYFVDGMHDAVITELAQTGALTVISRSSVLRYRDTNQSIPTIAGELGVEAVVEGSVLRVGDTVRIQAQLIGVNPERHLWAETYDEPLRDVLQLQSQVARAIAAAIQGGLAPEEEARRGEPRVVNPEAYGAYLKGQYHQSQFTHEGLRRATAYLEEAVAIDSTYAPAYAELAAAYTLRGGWFGDLTPIEAFPRAQTAAENALRLDSSLASGYVQLGFIRNTFNWDWPGAETAFRRALALDPNDDAAHGLYANFLRMMTRFDEALVHAKKFVELAPVTPMAWLMLYVTSLDANHPDEATRALEQLMELEPDGRLAQTVLGWKRVAEGDFEGAAEAYEAAAFPARAAGAFALAGMEDAARAALQPLYEVPTPPSVQIAIAHATLGDTTEAIRWLERAYRERNADMAFLDYLLEVDWSPEGHALRDLRSDPRVEAIFRTMDFPD
jgi:serine/threonine-protein kinase